MVMGLVSGWSLANHSDSESFLMVHALLNQDECQREGFGEVVRHVVSPFDFSWTLLAGGGLLVPCSLPGPPVVKHLMQMATVVAGQEGWLQSVCFPLTVFLIFLKRSLVFPILLFSFISLLRQALLSLLAILWNSSFRWVYLSFSPLPLASLLFSAICKASSDYHFAKRQFFKK